MIKVIPRKKIGCKNLSYQLTTADYRLMDDIVRNGMLEPITVVKGKQGVYWIIDGNRRYHVTKCESLVCKVL